MFDFQRNILVLAAAGCVSSSVIAAVPQPGEDVSPIACQVVWPINGNLVSYLDHMVTMGIDTARCDMMWWGLIESEAGVYDWNGSRYPGWEGWNVDRMIGFMNDRNIEPYVVLGLGNAVYNPAPNGIDWVSPNTQASRTAYANYCAEAAARYKDDVHYWEIWNEPNLELFWGGTPNAADYTALVAAAVPAVRANDPDCVIIGGVTSGIDNGYLVSCFQAGLLDYVDVISVHPYRTEAPETIANEIAVLRANISSYTDREIGIWTGEWGYNTFFSEVDPIGQGKSLARMMLNNKKLDIDISVWFSIHAFQELDPSAQDDEWGLLTRALQPRPSYYAMQTMNTYMEAPIAYVDDPFSASLTGANSRTRIETYARNHGSTYLVAVWSTAWPTQENMNTVARTLTLEVPFEIENVEVVRSLDGHVYNEVNAVREGGIYTFSSFPYGDFPVLLSFDVVGGTGDNWVLE